MEIETRIEEALEYIQNDTDHALELFDGILKDQPKNINALNGKGSTLMKLHKNNEALDIFDYSLSIEENSSAYLNKGIISKINEDYKNALKCFDKALEYNPSLASIVSMFKDEIMETINLESEIDSIYDYDDEANFLIKEALNYKKQNKLWDALDCFERAIETDPSCRNSVNDLIRKAESLLQKEFLFKTDFENTTSKEYNKKTYTKIKKINKIKSLALKSLTVENNPHKALSLIDKLFEIDEDDLEGLNYQGAAYFILKNYDKSIESFDRCLSIDDDYTYAIFNKGLVLRRMKFLDESLECFQESLKYSDFHEKIKPYEEEVIIKLKGL